jgi:hypothetical protein
VKLKKKVKISFSKEFGHLSLFSGKTFVESRKSKWPFLWILLRDPSIVQALWFTETLSGKRSQPSEKK